MKIVSTELPNAYVSIARAAQSISDDFLTWVPSKYPVFDLLDNISPDMILIDLKYITSTTIAAFNEHPYTKIILFGQGVPQGLHPSVVVAKPNTSRVLRKNIEAGPHATLYLSDCANVVDIFNQPINNNLSCDVGYLLVNTDMETYVEQILLLARLINTYKVKIVGPHKVALPQYLGIISLTALSSFYVSASIMLDYKGTIILDVAANGGFALSTVSNGLYPHIESMDGLQEQIGNLLKQRSTRNKIAREAQLKILQHDTCYHRLIDILKAAKMHDEAQRTTEFLRKNILCVLE